MSLFVNKSNSDIFLDANVTYLMLDGNATSLPPNLGFTPNALKDIIVYSFLFVVAAVGNLTVFLTLVRSRYRKSRINLMIMNLAAADLIVTFVMIPMEIGWRITTQWKAGNVACKILQVLRAFGLYLSSMVLVCVSLDRYFAILHPLRVNDARRRGKLMLFFAWIIAAICSAPQSIIFHVDRHPNYPDFVQCVTFNFFKTQAEERAYNLFCLSAMYFIPLCVIVVAYVRILWEISQKSKDSRRDNSGADNKDRLRLRRSDVSSIERARTRTLRMTIVIVCAFVFCWTPYVIMVCWYMFDRESAEQVASGLQDAFFIMAASNSCVNPLVYGTCSLNVRKTIASCCPSWCQPTIAAPVPQLARKPTNSTNVRTMIGASTKANVRDNCNRPQILANENLNTATRCRELNGINSTEPSYPDVINMAMLPPQVSFDLSQSLGQLSTKIQQSEMSIDIAKPVPLLNETPEAADVETEEETTTENSSSYRDEISLIACSRDTKNNQNGELRVSVL